jgi:hypothetical protein
MQKKPTAQQTTRTVTAAEVREALARRAPELAAEEEKVLRMRHGAPATRTLVLERVGQDHPDAREKLLGIEMELLRQWRERQSAARPAPAAAVARPAVAAANPRRDKIVQALRTRKSR